MSDDAAILRKIAALLARAEDSASSPAEVAHAIQVADKLMRRYNLSRDDVRLRQEEMRRSERRFSRDESSYANILAVAIGRLAQCRTSGERDQSGDYLIFSGLRPDVDYAEWLFRAIWSAFEQGWEAYGKSPQYERLMKEHGGAAAIEEQYKTGFLIDITRRIKALAEANAAATGTDLICLKNELIEQAFGPTTSFVSKTSLMLIGDLQAAYRSGAVAGRRVGLRQTIEQDDPPPLVPRYSGPQARSIVEGGATWGFSGLTN